MTGCNEEENELVEPRDSRKLLMTYEDMCKEIHQSIL